MTITANRFTIATRAPGKRADGRFDFIASTETTEAVDGLVLKADEWDLERFIATGGPISWSHDYSIPNVARATDVGIRDKELRATIEFDDKDPFAATLRDKYERRFLTAVSVGWFSRRLNGRNVNTLLEISCVSIPSDPNALLVARSAVAKAKPQTGAELVAAIDRALGMKRSTPGEAVAENIRELARLLELQQQQEKSRR